MVDHATHPKPNAASGQSLGAKATPDDGADRVAKALARAGVASRREVERLIAEGRVALNGQVLTTPAVKVGRSDILTVNGEVVGEKQPTRLWRYHKPVGLVTTHSDPKGRATVFQHLPLGLPRVISVGRLDLSSEGLLLLTNDGELARALELPDAGLIRRYRARAYGRVDPAKLDRLKAGTTVDGVAYGPIDARLDKVKRTDEEDLRGPANLWITVSLAEGKNREVRRVLESIGLKVNRLIRLAYGPFALGTLAAGWAEEVGPRVIRELLSEHIAPENMPTGDRVGSVLKPSQPAGASRRDRRSGAVGSGPTSGEGPPVSVGDKPAKPAKPLYKAGWAKPKKRPLVAPARSGAAHARPGRGPRAEATPGRDVAGRPPAAARPERTPKAKLETKAKGGAKARAGDKSRQAERSMSGKPSKSTRPPRPILDTRDPRSPGRAGAPRSLGAPKRPRR